MNNIAKEESELMQSMSPEKWYSQRIDEDGGPIHYEAHGPKQSFVIFNGPNAKADCELFFQAINQDSQGGWRDIASAPKDGRSILVAGGTVSWRMNYQRGTQATGENGWWFSHSAQRFLEWQPTHWQPLPPAPQKGNLE